MPRRDGAPNPRDFPQLFQEHQDYKRHISNIINAKALVDSRAPTRFNHIRQKDFKEQFFKKRDQLHDNKLLVSKILNAKVCFFGLNFIVNL
jgi:hypothetical protein